MTNSRLLTVVIVLFSLVLTALGWAHQPRFYEGVGPFEVEDPTISKAYYMTIYNGEIHTFIIPALERTIPVQVLVLDDELGRSLEMFATATCNAEKKQLSRVDQPFYEPYSKIEHRYRVVDAIGPTDGPCVIEIEELAKRAGPYVFSVGDEERFGINDILGMVNLGRKLNAWKAGP
ncbi:MAG: hypothetical protein CMO31_06235 [Trueperaceae bacterium]|jgi:hypothetical protein|nr:hypothetical protein [Trueperaceae bacterium]|tara:strand:+ start:1804 stop:2331 length:528 start_codon:yes stop_codon:yes gene_type:complete